MFVEFTLDGFAKANLAARYSAYRQELAARGSAQRGPSARQSAGVEGGELIRPIWWKQ